MKNKLHLVQKTVFLACNWVPTGDPKMPLACIWTGTKNPQAGSTPTPTDAIGSMPQCA